MDALALLREVSDAYRKLDTLAIEAIVLSESGDEDSSSRNQQRVRFFYATPDRIRYEQCGRNGMVQVVDGAHLHTSLGGRHFGPGPSYVSVPVSGGPVLPHQFRPDFPFTGGDEVFLYQRIEERVSESHILREEDGCFVISVAYEPSAHGEVIFGGPAVLLWVNAGNRMILRQERQQGHRLPTEDEVTWIRYTLAVQKMHVNQSLPHDTFVFTPPPGAVPEAASGCGVSSGGGSGLVEHTVTGRRVEHRGSHTWDGDTLVEHSRWKIRDVTLTFERRLTFSSDGKELHVGERIDGPKERVEGDFTIPVS
jgi:hypothetical protein